jgi:alkanesulfonate monooxygenase SsuD/methylene tetrahydromethanopterin reductase-like flavin-dependent oxidoreductase (luciferase family)
MIDALGVAGTPETARDRLRDLLDLDAIDEPIIAVPQNASAELRERTIEELAPERL